MKKIYFALLWALSLGLISQNQANTWYFSNGAGLNFNGNCSPTVLTNGQINGFEGCTTISDKTSGQLLFYTNSENVWNRNHQLMPNSGFVPNGNTITQVVIIQKPGFDSTYYIFTSQLQSQGLPGLKLSEVDMTLNSGLGGITFKNNVICPDTMTESMTAVQHSNGVDIWVIAHKSNSNNFLAYLVTSGGVSTSPVVSAIGKRRRYSNLGYGDEIGELKASPNGTKLAAVTYQNPNIELFDFNKSTGQISNLITLPEIGSITSPTNGTASGLYGASFSPNNKFLYISKATNPTPAKIIQYDISSNDSTTINGTRVDVFTSSSVSLYSLKLGPDKRIYAGQNNTPYLGVINLPDSSGLNCNYVNNGIYLNGKVSNWGLNNLMEYSSYCSSTVTGIGKFGNEAVVKGVYPNPIAGTSTLTFENPANKPYRLFIYNTLGQIEAIKEGIGNEIKIEKNELYHGVFFYTLQTDAQVNTKGKFFIE